MPNAALPDAVTLTGFHATDPDSAALIEQGGFRLGAGRLGYGRLFGDGVYLALTATGAIEYALHLDEPVVLTCRADLYAPLRLDAGDLSSDGIRGTYETLYAALGHAARRRILLGDPNRWAALVAAEITAAGYDSLLLDRSGVDDDSEAVLFDPSRVVATDRVARDAVRGGIARRSSAVG